MSLENATDNLAVAAVALAVGSANYDLQSVLKRDAICGSSIAPLPLEAIERTRLPHLSVWRSEDRDDSDSYDLYQERTTLRFDYFCDPTPHGKYFDRWDILRATWDAIYRNVRLGCHPQVAGGANLIYGAAFARYELGSARVRYLFAPDGAGNLTYPAFQGQMDFNTTSERPAGVKQSDIDAFLRLKVEWQLEPQTNSVLEATDTIELEQ